MSATRVEGGNPFSFQRTAAELALAGGLGWSAQRWLPKLYPVATETLRQAAGFQAATLTFAGMKIRDCQLAADARVAHVAKSTPKGNESAEELQRLQSRVTQLEKDCNVKERGCAVAVERLSNATQQLRQATEEVERLRGQVEGKESRIVSTLVGIEQLDSSSKIAGPPPAPPPLPSRTSTSKFPRVRLGVGSKGGQKPSVANGVVSLDQITAASSALKQTDGPRDPSDAPATSSSNLSAETQQRRAMHELIRGGVPLKKVEAGAITKQRKQEASEAALNQFGGQLLAKFAEARGDDEESAIERLGNELAFMFFDRNGNPNCEVPEGVQDFLRESNNEEAAQAYLDRLNKCESDRAKGVECQRIVDDLITVIGNEGGFMTESILQWQGDNS